MFYQVKCKLIKIIKITVSLIYRIIFNKRNFKYGDKYIESLAHIVIKNPTFSKYLLGNNRIK